MLGVEARGRKRNRDWGRSPLPTWRQLKINTRHRRRSTNNELFVRENGTANERPLPMGDAIRANLVLVQQQVANTVGGQIL